MKFLIPTYGRECQLTLEYLIEGGAEVRLQTQSEADMEAISKRYGGVDISCDESATNLAQNANNGLRSYRDCEIIAVMDDDIRHAILCRGGHRSKASAAEFVKRVQRLSEAMDERRADVAVGFPSNGIAFRDAGGGIVENRIGSGWLMLVRVGSCWYDESLTSCEDYEMQLSVIARGGLVLRDNGVAPQVRSRTVKNGLQHGGRGFYYEDAEHQRNVGEVVRRYWPLAKYARNGTAVALNSKYA